MSRKDPNQENPPRITLKSRMGGSRTYDANGKLVASSIKEENPKKSLGNAGGSENDKTG